jgi:hypothetical protein
VSKNEIIRDVGIALAVGAFISLGNSVHWSLVILPLGVFLFVLGYFGKRNELSQSLLFTPTLKDSLELREAELKTEKEKLQLATASIHHRQTTSELEKMQDEEEILEYRKALDDYAEKAQARASGFILLQEPTAAEGEDAVLLKEAWRRYKKDRDDDFFKRYGSRVIQGL